MRLASRLCLQVPKLTEPHSIGNRQATVLQINCCWCERNRVRSYPVSLSWWSWGFTFPFYAVLVADDVCILHDDCSSTRWFSFVKHMSMTATFLMAKFKQGINTIQICLQSAIALRIWRHLDRFLVAVHIICREEKQPTLKVPIMRYQECS